jgi:large subunit ribosomal protein L33
MSDRFIVAMACDVCQNRNYYFSKGKKQEGKLALRKFCKKCGKTTYHRETK